VGALIPDNHSKPNHELDTSGKLFHWEASAGGELLLGAGDGAGEVGWDGWLGGPHGLIIMEEERGVAGWWRLSLQRPGHECGQLACDS